MGDFMWVDVSMSPCGGCYLALDNFIDAQRMMAAATKRPFKFQFSFNKHYTNDGRSDELVPTWNVDDPSSKFRQVINTGEFLKRCEEKDDHDATFQFQFVEDYRYTYSGNADLLRLEHFISKIITIYWSKPNQNEQEKVHAIVVEFDRLRADFRDDKINEQYFKDRVAEIIDAFSVSLDFEI